MWKLFSQRPLKRTQRIFRIAYRASRDGNTCHYYKHVSASFGVCLLYIYISLSLSVNYTIYHIIQVIHHYTTIFVSIPGFDAELPLTSPLVPLDPDWEPVFMTCPAQVWIACRALTLSFRKNGPLLWVNQEKQEEKSINEQGKKI